MTMKSPTRGTAWFSDGEQAYVIDFGNVEVTMSAPLYERSVDRVGNPDNVTIVGDLAVTRHADPSVAQDTLDGAALRRLREALPEEWRWAGYQNPDGSYGFMAHKKAADGWTTETREGHGATIAEAADECREALTDDRR